MAVPLFIDDAEFDVPYTEIANSLAQLVGPVCLGMIINYFARRKSETGYQEFSFCFEFV